MYIKNITLMDKMIYPILVVSVLVGLDITNQYKLEQEKGISIHKDIVIHGPEMVNVGGRQYISIHYHIKRNQS